MEREGERERIPMGSPEYRQMKERLCDMMSEALEHLEEELMEKGLGEIHAFYQAQFSNKHNTYRGLIVTTANNTKVVILFDNSLLSGDYFPPGIPCERIIASARIFKIGNEIILGGDWTGLKITNKQVDIFLKAFSTGIIYKDYEKMLPYQFQF